MLLTPAQMKPKSFESRRNSSFFSPEWMRLMFTWVLGHYVASTVFISTRTFRWTAWPSLISFMVSVDVKHHVYLLGGQLRGDKE